MNFLYKYIMCVQIYYCIKYRNEYFEFDLINSITNKWGRVDHIRYRPYIALVNLKIYS